MLAFSALADPTRLRIVEMLASKGSLAASDISRRFTISPPAISQHLKVLREADLVQVEVAAQQRIYSLNPGGITGIESWVSQMRNLLNDRFDTLDHVLAEEMKKIKKAKMKPGATKAPKTVPKNPKTPKPSKEKNQRSWT